MQAKEKVRELLDRLPDDCSLDDVLYHLYVLEKIDHGTQQLDADQKVPHEEVAEELRKKWTLGAAG